MREQSRESKKVTGASDQSSLKHFFGSSQIVSERSSRDDLTVGLDEFHGPADDLAGARIIVKNIKAVSPFAVIAEVQVHVSLNYLLDRILDRGV